MSAMRSRVSSWSKGLAVLSLLLVMAPSSVPSKAGSLGLPVVASEDPLWDRAFDFDRILNGVTIDGETRHVQWTAALLYDDNPHCGAAFVQPLLVRVASGANWIWSFDSWDETNTPRWAVTAAHCVVNSQGQADKTRLTIWGGTVNVDPNVTPPQGEQQRVLAVYVPQADEETRGVFQSLTYENDIALLRLSAPQRAGTDINNNRRSIVLPAPGQERTLHLQYAAVFTAGWGKKAQGGFSSPDLQEVVLPFVASADCRDFFSSKNQPWPPGMLCAGFSTGLYAHCQGDSGGPLYYRPDLAVNGVFSRTEVLLGIVSWGEGCQKPGSFGAYSSALYFASWLVARILEYCRDPAAVLAQPEVDDCLDELRPGAL